MKILALVFLVITASVGFSAEAQRSLTVKFASDQTDLVVIGSGAIQFDIVLTALSVEDRNQFEALVIDDWRYDTPNYFTDRRAPNIVLHVERFDGSRWEPVGFRASSQGGGGNLEKASVGVDLFITGRVFSNGNGPGRYRITATYTGLRANQGRVLLTTGPFEVRVQPKPSSAAPTKSEIDTALPN